MLHPPVCFYSTLNRKRFEEPSRGFTRFTFLPDGTTKTMSDIKVVEITAEEDPYGEPILSNRKSLAPPMPQAQPGDRWIRTKYCWCPDHLPASEDCRYHSRKEKGWETCPWERKSGRGKGRWLWISVGTPVSDEDLSIGADIKDLSSSQQRAGDRYLK